MIKIAIVKLLFPEVGNWPWFGTIRVSLRNGSVVVVCVCNSWITVRVKTRALNHVIFTFKSVWGNVRTCRGSRGPRCFATFLFSICFLISILTRSICFFLFFFRYFNRYRKNLEICVRTGSSDCSFKSHRRCHTNVFACNLLLRTRHRTH